MLNDIRIQALDWLRSQSNFIRNLGVLAILLFGVSRPELTDAMLEEADENVRDFLGRERRRARRHWRNLNEAVADLFCVLVLAAPFLTALIAAMIPGLGLKAVLFLAIWGTVYLYVLRTWQGHLLEAVVVGLGGAVIKAGDRLRASFHLGEEFERDLTARTAPELLDRVIGQLDTIQDMKGESFMGGVNTVKEFVAFAYSFPTRILAWCSAGTAIFLFLPWHEHKQMVWAGLFLVMALLPFLTAYRRFEKEVEGGKIQVKERPVHARMALASIGLGIVAVILLVLLPGAKEFIDQRILQQAGFLVSGKFWAFVLGEVLILGILIVYELTIHRLTKKEGESKNQVARLVLGGLAIAWPLIGVLQPYWGHIATWQKTIGLIAFAVVVVGKYLDLKNPVRNFAVVVLVLLVGFWVFQRVSGRSGVWGAQFDYDAFARAQANLQAKPDTAPVEPAPKSLMLPSWGPPSGWTPGGSRSETPTPSPSRTPALASVLPVPTVPVVDDTLRQVLSPGMAPWRFKLPPGVYRIRYNGLMRYTTARPVWEYRKGQPVLVYPWVDSTGGKIPVSRRLRPKDYPMPDGNVGDPYIRFFDNPRVYHRLSGTRWDPITIPHEVVAEIGQNCSDWPIWEGNGSLCVTIVKVY